MHLLEGDQLAYEQYLYTVGLTLVEYVSYLLAVVISARLLLGKTHYAIVKYNYLAMAVILSSFGKPLHLFLMVWYVAFVLLFLLLPTTTCSSTSSSSLGFE